MNLTLPPIVSGAGQRFPSEKFVFIDRITGVPITALTASPANNAMIYPTHPQWAADGRHIIFRSNRVENIYQAFAVNEISGEIIQLTDGPGVGTGNLNVARLSNRLYFFRRTQEGQKLVELNLEPLLSANQDGTAISSAERVIMTMPENLRESGGFALDANEQVAYIGVARLDEQSETPPPPTDVVQELPDGVPERRSKVRGKPIPPRPSGIRSIDLQSGEIKTVIDVPFTMGHVQVNPWVPGEIIYCNETGGYVSQRMWCVQSDGTNNRPLYAQVGDEWVTHEVVSGRDEVMFSIMGHLARLRTRPTGIAVLNLRTDEMRIIGQVEERGFWHCNGSPDGRWAAGDTFTGSVYLLDRQDGKRTMLTTGHKMRPDHAHPTFSPDSKRILIQSGLLSDGASLDLMVVSVP